MLKEIHKELNPESVDRLMEQTSEAQAYQRVSEFEHQSRAKSISTVQEPDTISLFSCCRPPHLRLCQEVDDMLASKMTAEEEEEVQREMQKLEEQASGVVAGETNRPQQQQQQQQQPVPTLPDAPTAQPVRPVEEQKPQREQQKSEEERQPVLA